MTMITQIPVCFVYTFNYFFLESDGVQINMPDYMEILLHWLLLMNSAADPVIYGLMNPPFRRAYFRFLNSVRYMLVRGKGEQTVAAREGSCSYKR